MNRANVLMKQNVAALLQSRKLQQGDLAKWCRRSESWISKILKEDKRVFPMKYWDRIADFFGIVTYQLLQPGISAASERRRQQRRSGKDRRMSAIARAAIGGITNASRADWTMAERIARIANAAEREAIEQSIDEVLSKQGETVGVPPPRPRPAKATDPAGAAPKRRKRVSNGPTD